MKFLSVDHKGYVDLRIEAKCRCTALKMLSRIMTRRGCHGICRVIEQGVYDIICQEVGADIEARKKAVLAAS